MNDRIAEIATIHIVKKVCDGSGRRVVVQIDFNSAQIRLDLNDRRRCGLWQCKQQHQDIGGGREFCLPIQQHLQVSLRNQRAIVHVLVTR